jgi:hypothetical protein
MKRTARVRIQVIGVYDIDVEVDKSDLVHPREFQPDEFDWQSAAVNVAYDKQTLWIKETGKLVNVESNHAQFERWLEEDEQ